MKSEYVTGVKYRLIENIGSWLFQGVSRNVPGETEVTQAFQGYNPRPLTTSRSAKSGTRRSFRW